MAPPARVYTVGNLEGSGALDYLDPSMIPGGVWALRVLLALLVAVVWTLGLVLGAKLSRVENASFFDAVGSLVVTGGLGAAVVAYGGLAPLHLGLVLAVLSLGIPTLVYETSLGRGLVCWALAVTLEVGLGAGLFHLSPHLEARARAAWNGEGLSLLVTPGPSPSDPGSDPSTGSHSEAPAPGDSDLPESSPTESPDSGDAAEAAPGSPESPEVEPGAPENTQKPPEEPTSDSGGISPVSQPRGQDLPETGLQEDPRGPDSPALPNEDDPVPPVPPVEADRSAELPPADPEPEFDETSPAPPPVTTRPTPPAPIPPPEPADPWGRTLVGKPLPRVRAVDGYGEKVTVEELRGDLPLWLTFASRGSKGFEEHAEMVASLEDVFGGELVFVTAMDLGIFRGEQRVAATLAVATRHGLYIGQVLALRARDWPEGYPGDGELLHVLTDSRGKVRVRLKGPVSEADLRKLVEVVLDE